MSGDLRDLIARMPFAAQLGMTLEEASPERVVALLPWTPQLCTSAGVMHGGALMSLAVTAGTVRAVALPLNRGRTTATVQTSLYDEAGRLVAQTTQIQAIRPAAR